MSGKGWRIESWDHQHYAWLPVPGTLIYDTRAACQRQVRYLRQRSASIDYRAVEVDAQPDA